MFVVRLEIPETDDGWFVSVHRNEGRREGVHLPKMRDSFLRTSFLDGDGLREYGHPSSCRTLSGDRDHLRRSTCQQIAGLRLHWRVCCCCRSFVRPSCDHDVSGMHASHLTFLQLYLLCAVIFLLLTATKTNVSCHLYC